MKGFDDRKKGNEGKFAHDQEAKFKIVSRKRKLLGLWAAELIGLSEEESLNYAKDIIGYGIEDSTPGAVIKRIIDDAAKKNIRLTEAEVRTKSAEFEVIATKQILGETK